MIKSEMMNKNIKPSPETIIRNKLAALKQSKFRSKFKLKKQDQDYIAAKGIGTIKDHAYQFVIQRVAPEFPKNDGKQTPMRGHPVFIAQHATATCCRGCIQKWHAIRKGRALREREVQFIVALIMEWIEQQIDEKKDLLCENLYKQNFPKLAKIRKNQLRRKK